MKTIVHVSEPVLIRRASEGDKIHARLKTAAERPIKRFLWSEADEIEFVPYLLSMVYGDGRALFTITTINNRPRHWIVRCDSGWTCGTDYPGIDYQEARPANPDFGDFTDEILTDLEDQFGNARCAYCGSNLYLPKADMCECKECGDEPNANWPMVDAADGCAWGRMKWPAKFKTGKHPWTWEGNLLVPTEAIESASCRGCNHDPR